MPQASPIDEASSQYQEQGQEQEQRQEQEHPAPALAVAVRSLTQETLARALKEKSGNGLAPCRDQVRVLVRDGWDLERIAAAIEERAVPGLNCWKWLEAVTATGNGRARATLDYAAVGAALDASRRDGGGA
jgi:hypothetical protein